MRWIVPVAAAACAVLVGSWVYWQADGGGSPEGFRRSVADTGLQVEWTNNGSRGGDGVVTTDCGRRSVTVAALDTGLWVTLEGTRRELTPELVTRIMRCSDR